MKDALRDSVSTLSAERDLAVEGLKEAQSRANEFEKKLGDAFEEHQIEMRATKRMVEEHIAEFRNNLDRVTEERNGLQQQFASSRKEVHYIKDLCCELKGTKSDGDKPDENTLDPWETRATSEVQTVQQIVTEDEMRHIVSQFQNIIAQSVTKEDLNKLMQTHRDEVQEVREQANAAHEREVAALQEMMSALRARLNVVAGLTECQGVIVQTAPKPRLERLVG